MKTLIIILLITFLIPLLVLSQTLDVHKNDGTITNVELSSIQSITFTIEGGGSLGVPCPGIPTVVYEEQTYNTVQIGEQCWLRENLNVGTMITSTSADDNQTDNGTIEKYCYDNNETNCDTYGGLYQWDEMMQYVTTEGTQGICPIGWHIPTLAEFEALDSYVNNDPRKISEVGEVNDATNETGFSALLAGLRSYDGRIRYLGDFAYFWSSTEHDTNIYAYDLNLTINYTYIELGNSTKIYGVSIRCLKDD